MTETLSDIILRVATAGQTPYRKKFALEHLEKVKTELLDAIDGGDECRGRDSWLSELIRHVEDAMAQVRGIQE